MKNHAEKYEGLIQRKIWQQTSERWHQHTELGVAFSYIERNYFAGLKFRDFHVSPYPRFFKVITFRGARLLNFHFFILFNHNRIETQPATGWNVQQFQQHNIFLKVHWYKQPRHYLTHWPFRLGSAQCFQMDLQAIKLSNLEQVRIFALCSILLQRAAFPHWLSSGCKEPASSTSANFLGCKIVLLSPTRFV